MQEPWPTGALCGSCNEPGNAGMKAERALPISVAGKEDGRPELIAHSRRGRGAVRGAGFTWAGGMWNSPARPWGSYMPPLPPLVGATEGPVPNSDWVDQNQVRGAEPLVSKSTLWRLSRSLTRSLRAPRCRGFLTAECGGLGCAAASGAQEAMGVGALCSLRSGGPATPAPC